MTKRQWSERQQHTHHLSQSLCFCQPILSFSQFNNTNRGTNVAASVLGVVVVFVVAAAPKVTSRPMPFVTVCVCICWLPSLPVVVVGLVGSFLFLVVAEQRNDRESAISSRIPLTTEHRQRTKTHTRTNPKPQNSPSLNTRQTTDSIPTVATPTRVHMVEMGSQPLTRSTWPR